MAESALPAIARIESVQLWIRSRLKKLGDQQEITISRLFSAAFAKFGAILKNVQWSVWSINVKNEMVVSLWDHHRDPSYGVEPRDPASS